MLGRFGRPGLIGMAARTAVVAGTATAVSGGVMRHQQRKADEKYEAQQYEMQQAAAAAPPQYAPPQGYAQPEPAAPAAGGSDVVAQLQQLATLKAQGVLSEQEFEAAKAKLLA